jgi:hypothetical protein
MNTKKIKNNKYVVWFIIILSMITVIFVLYTFIYKKQEDFGNNPNRLVCINTGDPNVPSNDFSPWKDPCAGIPDEIKSIACIRHGNVKNENQQSKTCTFDSSDAINQYCKTIYDSSYSWPSQYKKDTQYCCLPAGYSPAFSAPEPESSATVQCKIPP